jgi:hypothetical protein
MFKDKCKIRIDFIPSPSIIVISFVLLPLILLLLVNADSNSSIALAIPVEKQNQTGIIIDTDKVIYVAGEFLVIEGKVDKVIEGKNIRVDFYDPNGKPILAGPKLVEPNEDGFFSLSGPFGIYVPSDSKSGEYTLLATYNKKSVETKITVK